MIVSRGVGRERERERGREKHTSIEMLWTLIRFNQSLRKMHAQTTTNTPTNTHINTSNKTNKHNYGHAY